MKGGLTTHVVITLLHSHCVSHPPLLSPAPSSQAAIPGSTPEDSSAPAWPEYRYWVHCLDSGDEHTGPLPLLSMGEWAEGSHAEVLSF